MTRTKSSPWRRLQPNAALRFLLASAIVFAWAIAGASSASAAPPSLCVSASGAGACPLGSTLEPSLEQAVIDAAEAEQTTIYLTPGTYTAATSFNLGSKPLRIVGVGGDRPVITAPAGVPGSSVISTMSPLFEIKHVTIAIPASTGMIGLKAANGGQEITDLAVRGGDASSSIGIALGDSNPTITDADISLDGGTGSTGISLHAATTPRIEGARISAVGSGIEVNAGTNFSIRRVQVTAANGLTVNDADGTISSSLLQIPAASNGQPTAIRVQSGANASASLNVFNCTLIEAAPGPGTGISATAAAVGSSASVAVDSTIISGFQTHAAELSDAASLLLRYTAYDGTIDSADAGIVEQGPGNRPSTSDYGFVDRAAGNFRLQLGSPLVDHGNPVIGDFTQADSGNDLDGLPRVVSRGGGKVRDIGAFEVQNSAPVPQVRILTAIPSTTATTEFSATGSTDAEGDALSFEWSFDGLPGSTGETAAKRFIAAGPHRVQLTVSDRAGASTTVRKQFDVAIGYLSFHLRSQRAQISRKGYIRLTLSCPVAAVSDCTGRLVLKTQRRVDAKRYTKRPGWASRATHIEAADHVFSIAPGETRVVSVRTFRTFQNVLAVKKRFKLSGALADATTGNAKLVSNRATYTIRAPKAKRRR